MKKNTIFNYVLLLNFFIIFSLPPLIFAAPDKTKIKIAALIYGNHNLITLNGFKKGMEEKGHIEGKNIEYIFYGPYIDKSKLDQGIKKLISKKPDLIFTATTPATLAAKKATLKNKIPVVFGPVNDPVSSGIVERLNSPGNNLTGVMLTDSTAKQLEWTKRISKKTENILLPYNPKDKSSLISYSKVMEAGKLLKLKIIPRKVFSHGDIDHLLKNLPEKINSIFLPRDGMIMSRVKDFSKIAVKEKLILSGTRLEMAQQGALIGFGFSGFELGKQISRLADQILKGIDPGKLPVETAEDYLAINLDTAKKSGLKVSETILRQAHIIIFPKD